MENLLIKTFHYYEELEGEVFIFGTCRPNKKRVFFFFWARKWCEGES